MELNAIDYVYINNDLTPINLIKTLNQIYILKEVIIKNDVTGNLELEIKELKNIKEK